MPHQTFKHYSKVVTRTPLYSYSRLHDQNCTTLSLETVVQQLLRDPVFIEGLYWSSPQLWETVLQYNAGHLAVAKQDKLLHTLKKYAIRASTRATPFGIYAGCALEAEGKPVENEDMPRRSVRIDMGLLQQIVKKIESHPVLWRHLHYQVNNSCYCVADQLRFTEVITDEEGKQQYQVSAIEQTALLKKMVAWLQQNGKATITQLYTLSPEDVSYQAFEAFVQELIEAQLLVSELQPGVTMEHETLPVQTVLSSFVHQQITGAAGFLTLLHKLDNTLTQLNALPLGTLPVAALCEVEALLEELDIIPEQRHIFHADLYFPPPVSFPWQHVSLQELTKAMAFFSKLSITTSPLEALLDRFKKRFAERYETMEMPLLEVLDPEFGIGFPVAEGMGNMAHNALLEKWQLPGSKEMGKRAAEGNAWLQDKMELLNRESLFKGIHLEDNDMQEVDDRLHKLSNHFAIMGAYLPSGKIILHNAGGAHANILLGRFAYLDTAIDEFCKQLAMEEQDANEQVLFAELIHMPPGRISNIARRERFSGYEIPFLAASAAEAGQQLMAEDIMVSVQQEEIVLRSRKHNKRIIPRLSNAHNYMGSSITAYKFLAAIQYQGTSGFEINWGAMGQYKRFLPRIAYRQFILHRASWLLRESDIRAIQAADSPMQALRIFCKEWQVPQRVCFCEGDHELFIDTTNDEYLQVLLKEMKGCSVVKLVEWLYDTPIDEGRGAHAYAQQFILPLARLNPLPVPALLSKALNGVQRYFEPGSEWLYVKVFCGAKVTDQILKHLKPVLDNLLSAGIIEKFFFIRYADPHCHIRLRLQLSDTRQYQAVVQQLYPVWHPYLESRLIWKVQQDTYQREIERYGEKDILAAEAIFFYDSQAVLACLQEDDFEEDEQVRLFTAVCNMEHWLNAYHFSLQDKITYCEEMSEAFSGEFGREVKRKLNKQYPEWKTGLAQFQVKAAWEEAFAARTARLQNMELSLENISSYIHMSMNRWFTAEQRLMEYITYHFCVKFFNQMVHLKNEA
ncbi:thiopeptide-type bacteriocin biosynthesis domain-containing protein [Filimonas lacunae]|uniref:Thiopeptide-type bacteriocin biosynthesis domain-containing protein n=1 Tax=Filimonas lacunae TaxID=477680 RepID=A0A173MBG5_9BACT|nr:lantibiotic dehydratase [Filimonas lacunae]BAV04877.1 lanthionine biosynthesis protein LanB [Filimonas lacunae]SIT34624.1 thiopeptide-type bacteriocin biosynthesis domain-containing protein [Filimonas lacunae]